MTDPVRGLPIVGGRVDVEDQFIPNGTGCQEKNAPNGTGNQKYLNFAIDKRYIYRLESWL
jgi:hypothetical protein